MSRNDWRDLAYWTAVAGVLVFGIILAHVLPVAALALI